MTYTDVVSRVGAIQDQIASLRTAFVPSAASATQASSSASPAATSGASATGASSFASALQSALGTSATGAATSVLPSSPAAGATGAALPGRASTMLTSDQQRFASRLAAETGLDTGVVSAWLLAEESGGAATSRQAQNNNDWLNIGYTDSGTYGAADGIWSTPEKAADATAGWLKGRDTIPGYGTASSGIQGILSTAGQPAANQIAALQKSGWASSGYPSLGSLLQQVDG